MLGWGGGGGVLPGLCFGLCVCTWPPAPCAGPPGCGYCSSAESVCRAAPPAPPPAAAAAPSSARGPASELPSWPRTPPAPAPTPWTRPPEPHTGPRSRCSAPALLHAGSSEMLGPPVCVCTKAIMSVPTFSRKPTTQKLKFYYILLQFILRGTCMYGPNSMATDRLILPSTELCYLHGPP